MTYSKELPLEEQLKKDVHQALKNWFAVNETSEHLLTHLFLVQTRRFESRSHLPITNRLFTNEVLLQGLKQLGEQQPLASKILEKRFHDRNTILEVSQDLNLSVDQVKHKQRQALDMLTNILYVLEIEIRERLVAYQKSQLESKSYTALFGIAALSDRLLTLLTTGDSPWVITLVGIGGIGKTSLANFTVRQAIGCLYYEEVVWLKIANVTKRPYPKASPEQTFQHLVSELCKKLLPSLPKNTTQSQRLLELQQLFKNQRYLVIIDNLELKEDTSYLLSELVTLGNPSRFLLTSRTPPVDHSGSLTLSLPELSETDSIALIKHYSGEIGFTEAAEASFKDLLPIYQLIGGNPFALKHLINLAKMRPLPALLVSLKKRPLTDGKAIYQHILREIWLTLSDEAKAVLSVMPLAADGGMDPEQMAVASRLPEEKLWPAINELIGRSLLEVRNSNIWARFYGIHRLTELFVRSLLEDETNDI